MKLTHINDQGHAKMVDVSNKDITNRVAVAHACIAMKESTLQTIIKGEIKKGDVLAVAQVAGIMAVKNTASVIPMCHPLMISGVDIEYVIDEVNHKIEILCSAKVSGKTGIEMEVLHGATVCALTIYDMGKAIDKAMVISDIYLVSKSGGKSGVYQR